jgi:hypothetical protein
MSTEFKIKIKRNQMLRDKIKKNTQKNENQN